MPEDPASRLGWIEAPRLARAQWSTWTAFARAARADGLDRVLVCGMGGSSLAPQVLAESFGVTAASVLDSTAPAAVRDAVAPDAVAHTLFVITSKSGTTVETLAFFEYFAARAHPGQFVVVTDPGTPLEARARAAGLRAVFPHPPDVGGRYAALTVVGMLPAALMGIDGAELLDRAGAVDVAEARALGAELAAATRRGQDKLALRLPPRVARLADWIEQLIAESSGKSGLGMVPVVDPPAPPPAADRVMVEAFSDDPRDLGREFLRWEYATWALCDALGVNAFDQPDVEDAKARARAELARPADAAASLATLDPGTLAGSVRPGDYLAILAYLPPRPDVAAVLQQLRARWQQTLGVATTLGFGPRYLHSTGQLHKGGPNTGLFLVLTADPEVDLEIPGMGLSFGRLQHAQARGDIQALLARGRRVAHLHLPRVEDLARLAGPP